jgi:GNAT superfamily N-acetyltransferase
MYWDNRRATKRFKEFLIAIHGLDLSLWEQRGYWDYENYHAFSLFEGERIVATTNLFSMEMLIDGRRRRLGQFSGVGTLPEFRRRGLNRWLTERALKWAAPTHDGFFLFADQEAIPFYDSCGFVPLRETVSTLRVERPAPRPGLRKLDPDNDADLEWIHRLACERSPISRLLGAWTEKLLMFHCLYTLRDDLYYLPDLDVAVFFRVDDRRLTLFDVVGREVPSFAELHPYISELPHDEVRFHFMPDKLDVVPSSKTPLKNSNAQVYPPLRLPGPDCLFPYSAHA